MMGKSIKFEKRQQKAVEFFAFWIVKKNNSKEQTYKNVFIKKKKKRKIKYEKIARGKKMRKSKGIKIYQKGRKKFLIHL